MRVETIAFIGFMATRFVFTSACIQEGAIWYGGHVLGDPTIEDSWQDCGIVCQSDADCDGWYYGQSFTFFDTQYKCYKYKFTGFYHYGNTPGMVAGLKNCPEPVPTESPTKAPTASPTYVPCHHMNSAWGNAFQIDKTQQTTWEECGEYCESNVECEAWFYYPAYKICWSLKESSGGEMYLAYYPNFIAGLSTCPSPCVQDDVYITGLTDLDQGIFDTWHGCRQLCQSNANCKAWNYNIQYGMCSTLTAVGDQQMIVGGANPGQYIAGFTDCSETGNETV